MSTRYHNAQWNGKKVIIGESGDAANGTVTLLIGFHGAESTPENLLIHGNRLAIANILSVYPEGPVDAGQGFWSWWQDGPKQLDTVNAFVRHTDGVIGEALKYARETRPNRECRLCLWGFSQGAAAVLVYTLLGAHPVHKAVSICGFLPEMPPATPTSRPAAAILGIFGANDGVVPSFLAEFALDEVRGRGQTVTAKETPQGHEVSEENLREAGEFLKN